VAQQSFLMPSKYRHCISVAQQSIFNAIEIPSLHFSGTTKLFNATEIPALHFGGTTKLLNGTEIPALHFSGTTKR